MALAAANLVVPGLGFLTLAAKWGVEGIRNSTTTAELVSDSRPLDLVEEVAPGVTQFARRVLPVVIFVEDLHRADESLVELLRRLLVLPMRGSWS